MSSRWSECFSYLELLHLLLSSLTHLNKDSHSILITSSSLLFLSPPIPLFSMADVTGNGTIYSVRGDVYRGGLRMGRPSGQGVLKYYNGCYWTGRWENGLREGEGEYHYSEEVWQKGVWRGNKQTVWKGVYSFSGRFDNAKRLFDVEKGWFPFAFEAEVNLGLLLDPAKT